MSAPVSTACTPGMSRAARVSIETILACTIVLGTKAAHSISGIEKSALYCASPETLMRPS
jgi:hypothetical protein